MSKFKKGNKKKVGAINTAALPDIVFMLLFFFMVSTVLRDSTLMVKITYPKATEIQKLEKKSLVSNIFIGKPKKEFQKLYGDESRIQLNDQFASVPDIQEFIVNEREQLDETDRNYMTISLKVDEDTKMGIVTDVKQALRRAEALKINYSTLKRGENEGF